MGVPLKVGLRVRLIARPELEGRVVQIFAGEREGQRPPVVVIQTDRGKYADLLDNVEPAP